MGTENLVGIDCLRSLIRALPLFLAKTNFWKRDS